MTSPAYKVLSKRETDKFVHTEMLEPGDVIRISLPLEWATSRRCYGCFEKYADGRGWMQCSEKISTNQMMKKLCILPPGIDPTPYLNRRNGSVLTVVATEMPPAL